MKLYPNRKPIADPRPQGTFGGVRRCSDCIHLKPEVVDSRGQCRCAYTMRWVLPTDGCGNYEAEKPFIETPEFKPEKNIHQALYGPPPWKKLIP